MKHIYVYYLLSPASGLLLYIGRSPAPERRRKAFERRTGCASVLGVCQRFADFGKACAAELEAIEKHWPPYNKVLVSSSGTFGMPNSPESRQKISKALGGMRKSEEHRMALSISATGRIQSDQQRQRHSAAMKGNKHCLGYRHSDTTKEKMAQAQRGRKHSAESIAKTTAAHIGAQRTEETKAKLRAAWVLRRAKKQAPV